MLPAPFNDLETVAPHEKTGAPIYMHAVGTQLPNGVKYTAYCTEGGDQKPDLLATLTRELAHGQPVRNLTVAGNPAAEVTTADGSGSLRIVDLERRFCMMIVEAQDKAQLAVPPSRREEDVRFVQARLIRSGVLTSPDPHGRPHGADHARRITSIAALRRSFWRAARPRDRQTAS